MNSNPTTENIRVAHIDLHDSARLAETSQYFHLADPPTLEHRVLRRSGRAAPPTSVLRETTAHPHTIIHHHRSISRWETALALMRHPRDAGVVPARHALASLRAGRAQMPHPPAPAAPPPAVSGAAARRSSSARSSIYSGQRPFVFDDRTSSSPMRSITCPRGPQCARAARPCAPLSRPNYPRLEMVH